MMPPKKADRNALTEKRLRTSFRALLQSMIYNALSRALEMKTNLLLPAFLSIGAALSVVAGPFVYPADAQRSQSSESLYRGAHTMHGKTVIIPIGVDFEGRIDHTIGSSISKPGERFEVEVSSPILANGTDVLIPAGSAVIGEVVECIPSSRLPHQRGFPKPTGKLRVQLSGLRTPDGVTYPMVASLAGETMAQGGGGGRGRQGRERPNTHLGHGVAYVGTPTSFEAVAPGAAQRFRTRPGQPPKLVTPQDIMRDAIYGTGQAGNTTSGTAHIRSLVKKNSNLWIVQGSPLSIRIDAPFKMGIAPAASSASVLDAPADDQERIERNGGRRFAKRGSKVADEEDQDSQQQVEQPLIPDVPQKGSFIQGNQIFQGQQGGGQPAQGGQGIGGSGGTMPSGAADGQKAPGNDF
ncbi:MAG: hypothetical protein C0469_18195 [Cyanobacteria bacterium DS2.3.42]|nr:hypothetical protein [Cyanobacteria bacterium DS2.3.42]